MVKYILLLSVSALFSQCQINYFTKPRIKKFYGYDSEKQYNFYKFYGNQFELQPGENKNSSILIDLFHNDSTFLIVIEDFDSEIHSTFKFQGKYSVDQNGSVKLLGGSPFKNDQCQIIMWHGKQSQCLKYKFNEKFDNIFSSGSQIAYCEGEKFSLEVCIVQ